MSRRQIQHKELNEQPTSNSVACMFGAALWRLRMYT